MGSLLDLYMLQSSLGLIPKQSLKQGLSLKLVIPVGLGIRVRCLPAYHGNPVDEGRLVKPLVAHPTLCTGTLSIHCGGQCLGSRAVCMATTSAAGAKCLSSRERYQGRVLNKDHVRCRKRGVR